MKRKGLLLLSVISGLIMTIAWIKTMMFGFLMLVAFVPLLFMEDIISYKRRNKERIISTAAFCYSYLGFLIFCLFNTLWITNATPVGYVVPIAEAAFMSIVFQVYSYCKKVSNNSTGAYFYLVLFWLGFEYIQFHWDINFPWLNLGNSFAQYPILVQWYSVLGMEGGTLWILLSNIFIYLALKPLLFKKFTKITDYSFEKENENKGIFKKYTYTVLSLLILAIPILWSVVLWFTYEDKVAKQVNVLCVQPNLDPYNEQYVLTPEEVMDRVINLSQPLMDTTIDYMLLPESCIQEYAWEDNLSNVPSIKQLKNFIRQEPKCKIIAGMSSKRLLKEGEVTPAARKLRGTNTMYESCNIAIEFDNDSNSNDFQIHHKSVLTVGVEKMPFKKYLKFIENLALDMGGTIGTLGVDKDVVVFNNKGITIGVPICYESIDGNYVRKFVNSNAQALFIITNVGWWGDTPGYKQYFAISRLRAIENRKNVVTCANTGFSGLVDSKGRVLEKSDYWVQGAFKYNVKLNNQQTFFSLHGDMFSKPMLFFAVLLLIYSIIKNKIAKR